MQIIGISGIGGAGKSTLTHALGKTLNATMLFWDSFDEISEDPKDYIEWYKTSRDYNEWKYDALADVLKELKAGNKIFCPATKKELIPTNYIIFDAPLGRNHISTGQYIDFSIFLETPLDIALARRLLRDTREKRNLDMTALVDQLDFYLTSSRPLYTMAYEAKEKYDLVIDGSLAVNVLIATILAEIKCKK